MRRVYPGAGPGRLRHMPGRSSAWAAICRSVCAAQQLTESMTTKLAKRTHSAKFPARERCRDRLAVVSDYQAEGRHGVRVTNGSSVCSNLLDPWQVSCLRQESHLRAGR